jgi:hypothetical protein
MFTVLADEPGGEIVVGAIDQAWRLDGGELVSVRDRGHFAEFDEPGFVKLPMAFGFECRDGGPSWSQKPACSQPTVAVTDGSHTTGRSFAQGAPLSGVAG